MTEHTDDLTSFDGTRLAVSTWGDRDAPVVVLVHGLGLSRSSWGRVPQLLADGHRVVGYDLRGHGRSGEATGGDYRLATHAADLGVVLESALPGSQRAVVVGHSFGGGVVLTHAHATPDHRMAGVVLAGSGASGVTLPGLPDRGLPAWAQAGLRAGWGQVLRSAALLARRMRRFETVSDRLVRRLVFTPDAPRAVVDLVREDFMSTRGEGAGPHDAGQREPQRDHAGSRAQGADPRAARRP